MREDVSLCDRDRIPICGSRIIWNRRWDIAEKAVLLGLGQDLIYSIEQTKLP
jgi:glutaconyl-CoA decarboxylase